MHGRLTTGVVRFDPLRRFIAASRWPTVLVLAAIAAATLIPGQPLSPEPEIVCMLCPDRRVADFILNIVLFGPLGAVLAGRRTSLVRTILVAGAISAGIELSQFAIIAGRDPTFLDVAANTAGAAAGWVALRSMFRIAAVANPRIDLFVASVAAAICAAFLSFSLLLMAPQFPDAEWLVQLWGPKLDHMAHYQGQVTATGVGPLTFRIEGLIAPPDRVLSLVRSRSEIRARVRSKRPYEGIAPVLLVHDDRQRELLMLGTDGDDVVYRFRTRSQAFLLDQPQLRFPDALRNVQSNQAAWLSVSPHGSSYELEIDNQIVARQAYTVADTWMLLYAAPDWDTVWRRLAQVVWLAVAFLPVGLVAGSWRVRAAATAVALIAVTLLSLALGSAAPPAWGLLAVMAGSLGGGFARGTLNDVLHVNP